MLAEGNIVCQSSHKREKYKTNICRFFLSKAGCKFGDNCRFKHEFLSSSHSATSEEVSGNFERESSKPAQNEEGLNNAPSSSSERYKSPNTAEAEIGLVPTDQDPDFEGEEDPTFGAPDTSIKPKVCHHFVKRGWCRFGKRCRLVHPKRERVRISTQKQGQKLEKKLDGLYVQTEYDCPGDDGTTTYEEETVQAKKPSRRKQLCRFYLNGTCKYGGKCKFVHDGEEVDRPGTDVQTEDISEVQHGTEQPPPPTNPSRLAKRRGDLTADDISSLRRTECDQLKKRFPRGKLEVVSESEDVSCYNIQVVPTDPDWPFDIKSFCLKVEFPAQYPLDMFSVEAPDDDVLPSAVRCYIEKRTAQWLEEKQTKLIEADKVELVFRPFLRWFDRNLEDIVTEGLRRYQRELAAKAAGFEFIPAKPVSERRCDESEEEEENAADIASESDSEVEDSVTDSETESEQSSDEDEEPGAKPNYADVERKGTEILLRNLQLKENASTLLLQKLALIIQCARCKNTTEFSTPGARLNSIPCSKCYSDQRLVFRPSLAHHFSAVVGYLDLAGCQPYDLILQDCSGTVGCLNCSRDMKVEGLVPGQAKQTWCQRCHKKLTIATDSVRFQQLQPSELAVGAAVHQIQVNKARRVGRDPAIQEGRPLPAEGTCKHYKKSFRWLRFPCCGKCYPCDICHDDKEGDHEMKFASRMICGFCCKEQPYTVEKPCVSCGSQMTKTRSAHWEGGRGCRDKVKMSRNDIHKYANMSKTTSKKSQEKQDSKKSGKKTTKLRHT